MRVGSYCSSPRFYSAARGGEGAQRPDRRTWPGSRWSGASPGGPSKMQFPSTAQYSVQRNHFHLIAEARSTVALSRGMQGLAIRLARALNRAMHRTGRGFADRYRSRLLTDPLDARNTLRYVLNNARRHVRGATRNWTRWTDPCSSAPWFRYWSIPPDVPDFAPDQRYRSLLALGSAAVPPRTALLALGWSRAGPIDLLHVPGRNDVQPEFTR